MQPRHPSAICFLGVVFSLPLVSCIGTVGMTRGLASDFHRAAAKERIISAKCLSDQEKYGSARSAMEEQDGSILMNEWCGTLIKRIDKETHGSTDQQKAILLAEVRANGRLFFLQELNGHYHALSDDEFLKAADQSRKQSSALFAKPIQSGN